MIKSIKIQLAAWREYLQTVRELSMLSSRELADLGIGSGDIHFVANGSLRDAAVAHAAGSASGSTRTVLARTPLAA